jgi:hypothetical protein
MHTVAPYLDSPPLRRQSPPQLVRGVDPAAGANFAQSVNDGLYWRLVTVFFRLVTSADVADREGTIEYRDQEGSVYARFGAPVEVAAGTTIDYYYSAYRGQPDWPINSTILAPLDPLILPLGHSFDIVVAGIDNTDALSRIRYVVEKFYPDSADDYPAFE